MYIVRYADDFVMGFERQDEAERYLEALGERFAALRLESYPEKARLLEFGRNAAANRRARGEGRPGTFEFLGFTHCFRKARSGRCLERFVQQLKRLWMRILRGRSQKDRHAWRGPGWTRCTRNCGSARESNTHGRTRDLPLGTGGRSAMR